MPTAILLLVANATVCSLMPIPLSRAPLVLQVVPLPPDIQVNGIHHLAL